MVTKRYAVSKNFCTCLSMLLLCFGFLLPIDGIGAGIEPETIDPDRLQQDIEADRKLSIDDLEYPQPVLELRNPEASSVADPESSDRFLLTTIIFEGSTKLSDQALTDICALTLNQSVSLKDLELCAGRITSEYRNRGYVISQAFIPVQTVEAGVVRLVVVEGYVDQVDFLGNIPSKKEHGLRRFTDKLIDQVPLAIESVEEQLLLMNDLPGVSASAVFSPSPSGARGSSLLNVSAQKSLGVAAFEINNRATEAVGPWRASLDANRYFNDYRQSTLGLYALLTGETDELQYLSLNAQSSIFDARTRFRLDVSNSTSEPSLPGGSVSTSISESSTVSFRLNRFLLRSRNKNRSMFLSVRHSESDTDGFIYNSEDSITTLGIGLDLNWRRGFSINQLQLKATAGLDQERSSNDPFFQNETADAGRVNVSYAHLKPLRSNGLSLLAAVDAQVSVADGAMAPGQRFGLGGSRFVRAYDASTRTGDSGLAAKLELRKNMSKGASDFTLYGYLDTGVVFVHDDLGGGEEDLSAAGTGLRFERGKWAGYLELGSPLSDEVGIQDGDARVFFGLSAEL